VPGGITLGPAELPDRQRPDINNTTAILVAAYGTASNQAFTERFAAAQGVELFVTDQRGVVVADPHKAPRDFRSFRYLR